MFPTILAGTFEGHCPLRCLDVFEYRLNVFVHQLLDVVEDEHQAADFFDQVRVFLRQIFQQRFSSGAVGHVEDLGDARNTSGILKRLAHHAGHSIFEASFDFADHLGVGLPHVRDAANH